MAPSCKTRMSRSNSSLLFTCYLFLITLSLFVIAVVGHSHSHSHDDHEPNEPASFKYSRQANADDGPRLTPQGDVHHGHSHEHAHSHGHEQHHHAHSHGHEHSHSHQHGHSHGPEKTHEKSGKQTPAKSSSGAILWLEALGSTLLISAAPFVILFFVPLNDRSEQQPLLKVLLSFASGGLLGDAFLHLIPHALLEPHDHSQPHTHSHSASGEGEGHDLSVGLWVLAGIVTFLIVEKFVRIVKGGHGHSHGHVEPKNEGPNHGHSHAEAKCDSPKKDSKEGDDKKKEQKEVEKEGAQDDSQSKGHTHEHAEEEVSTEQIKVAGYLNLAADFTHNFTDGLAIGASFMAGRSIGLITTFTILLHEVPHEIGDFAILVQSGCNKRKAIMLQLLTAVGALTGTVVSLISHGETTSQWVLPFTAGGFIYIATVSVIPELLENSDLWQSVKEVLAMLLGILLMVAIVFFE